MTPEQIVEHATRYGVHITPAIAEGWLKFGAVFTPGGPVTKLVPTKGGLAEFLARREEALRQPRRPRRVRHEIPPDYIPDTYTARGAPPRSTAPRSAPTVRRGGYFHT